MVPETTSVSIEADGETDEIEIPTAITDAISEENETAAQVVADLAVLSLAQQAHGIVHHSPSEVGDELEAAEQEILDIFERRFGQSFAEMTGHSH